MSVFVFVVLCCTGRAGEVLRPVLKWAAWWNKFGSRFVSDWGDGWL